MAQYDLSILNKFVLVGPLVVFRAQVFSFVFPAAETTAKSKSRKTCPLYDFLNIPSRVWWIRFTLSPRISMMSPHVSSVIIHQLQVLNTVICFVMVPVMDSLIFGKRTSKMLLHYVTVLKNSLAFNVNSDVS